MTKELPCPHCGQDLHIPARYNAENIAQLEADLLALRERAERVQEGEDWNLAEFIIQKTDALADAQEKTP